jgi:hypothetical protein
MTREDITKLAQEAGLHLATDVHWMPIIGLEYAEKFAGLVAAAEREACAEVCEQIAHDYDGSPAGTGADNCSTEIRRRK